MFYLRNETTDELAHKDSRGQHDGLVTKEFKDAAKFSTGGEASDYSQNFGPD